MSYVPMTNTYMAPAPQYTYSQPAVYSTSQIPMQSPAPVTYTQPAPMPMPMTRAIEPPADAEAPPGYRLAGYAPAPESGNLPEGWEFVNGKWIYVGKPEPEPQMRAIEMPITNYTSVAIPQPQPVTYAPQPVTYTQPQVFATQQMPVTYGSVPPVAQYY